MLKTQNVWFVGFDAKPKTFSKNFSFIYILSAFLGKKVTLIGKDKNSRRYLKITDVLVRQRGTGGYLLVDSQWLGKDMRFYIYESKNSVMDIKNMLSKP